MRLDDRCKCGHPRSQHLAPVMCDGENGPCGEGCQTFRPAPTLPPVGERPVYHYCCECGERLPTRWNEPYCTEHRALLTSRPSPAPSGEPVAFQMRHRRLGGEFCGWEDFVTRENRERWAAIATRQGLHVELRDLIPVAAPHPDGRGVG